MIQNIISEKFERPSTSCYQSLKPVKPSVQEKIRESSSENSYEASLSLSEVEDGKGKRRRNRCEIAVTKKGIKPRTSKK